MTTQVHERIPVRSLPPRRRSPRGSWILFLAATLLAALAIGVVAALLGNAVKGVTDARGLLSGAIETSAQAETDYQSAVAAEQAAIDRLDERRAEVIDELAARADGSSYADLGAQHPAVAELNRLETQIEDEAIPARIAADSARTEAATAVTAAEGELAQAEARALSAEGPLWITIVASAIVLVGLGVFAVVRTVKLRRQ